MDSSSLVDTVLRACRSRIPWSRCGPCNCTLAPSPRDTSGRGRRRSCGAAGSSQLRTAMTFSWVSRRFKPQRLSRPRQFEAGVTYTRPQPLGVACTVLCFHAQQTPGLSAREARCQPCRQACPADGAHILEQTVHARSSHVSRECEDTLTLPEIAAGVEHACAGSNSHGLQVGQTLQLCSGSARVVVVVGYWRKRPLFCWWCLCATVVLVHAAALPIQGPVLPHTSFRALSIRLHVLHVLPTRFGQIYLYL